MTNEDRDNETLAAAGVRHALEDARTAAEEAIEMTSYGEMKEFIQDSEGVDLDSLNESAKKKAILAWCKKALVDHIKSGI